MIELNLLERKAPMKMPVVLGVDLATLNFRFLFIAILLYYLPGYFLESFWVSEIENLTFASNQKTNELQKLNKDLGSKGDIQSKLDAYNNQVENLKIRSQQVDDILKERANPRSVLEKIARSLSDEIWFDTLEINEKRELIVIGGAHTPQGVASYRIIGQFVNLLNDSPFFNETVTIVSQNQVSEEVEGVKLNYDKFEIKAQVKNFDAFNR
jgi:Tfp pilus assembly protein PilN